MVKANILFVEDDRAGREMGVFNLEKAGYGVTAVASGEEGIRQFSPAVHQLVITDMRMPGISGMAVLSEIKRRSVETPVLVITAYAKVDLAVEAMKAGAFDFIGKPFNRDHLLLVVDKALAQRRLASEVKDLRIRASGIERPIIYSSGAMARVVAMADKVAASEATVLVTGESGTGKELVARRIHVHSDRATEAFVAVNAAAMPAELLESELFGHEKGAFTGAIKARAGRFRLAHQGTIFLDEIAELSTEMQGKLLRILQERVVDVVGADQPVPIDVRVIAATNRDLQSAVARGQFRDDLYYRLNVVEISIPPLRDRPEDIKPLVEQFIQVFAEGRELVVPESLYDRLCAWSWPGNVRELENVCQRLVILATGESVTASDLPSGIGEARGERDGGLKGGAFDAWPSLPDDGLSLMDLERRVIERVLEMKAGNVSQAASYLRIPRHVLAYRMGKYGIARRP